MRMPGWAVRGLRAILVAALAWVGFRWLEPRGYGLHALAGVGALALAWIGYRVWRASRARAEEARQERWAEALMVPERRPAAIAALRAELADDGAKGSARVAAEHARRSLVLAELLEAEGDPRGAMEALARVRVEELPRSHAALVRHARAVAALSAGDVDAATAALEAIGGPTGDRAIDLRVKLARGLVLVERGEPTEALELAEDARDAALGDRELATEASVLRAVALEALGRSVEADRTMLALGEDMLLVLSRLGLPRVRALAERARSKEG